MDPGQPLGKAKMSSQLQSVLDYLRSEGLFSAEQALLKDLEEKHAARPRPHGKGAAMETSRPSTPGEEGTMDRSHGGYQPVGGHAYLSGEMDTAERVVELWRSRSFTATPSPQRRQTAHSRSPSGNLLMPSGATSPGLESLDIDEYTDDDDPGFWRVEMSGVESAALFDDAGAPSESGRSAHASGWRAGGLSPTSSVTSEHGPQHSRRSSYDADTFRRMSSTGRPIALPTVPGGEAGPSRRTALASSLSRRWSATTTGGADSPRSSARAGTASWVFDGKNSASLADGAGPVAVGAFRSLLSHLDATGGARAGSPVRGPHPRASGPDQWPAPPAPEGFDAGPAPASAAPAAGVSRVSSLSESVVNGLAAAADEPAPAVHKEPSLSANVATQALVEAAMAGDADAPAVGSLGERLRSDGALPTLESSFAVPGSLGDAPSVAEARSTPSSDRPSPPAAVQLLYPPGSPMMRLGRSSEDAELPRAEEERPRKLQDRTGADPEVVTSARVGGTGPGSAPATPSATVSEQSQLFTFAAPSPPPPVVVEPGAPSASRLGSRRLSWRGAMDLPSAFGAPGSGAPPPAYAPLRSASSNSLQNLAARAGPALSRRADSTHASAAPLLGVGEAEDMDTKGPEQASPFLYGLAAGEEPPVSPASAGTAFSYDADAYARRYEEVHLRVVARRGATGFEESKEFDIALDDVLAGRFVVVELLGRAAFCRTVQAVDAKTGARVCLKIIKNSKDYFDQSLDEIRVLRHVNASDPGDEAGILRLYDYFYYREHLILVTELLRANLFEFQRHIRSLGEPAYFTRPRIASVARQVLRALAFLHSLGLLHADLKPENIVMKSYSRCLVKIIDLGSSCFTSDRLSTYVQSRSYRAPEVILGLGYDQKIDVWSLGCILAELSSGRVLLQNGSLVTLLARMESILGAVPRHMIRAGRFGHKYYTRDGRLFERNKHTHRLEYLKPKRTCLAWRLPDADPGMVSFLQYLLQIDPKRRPTAEEALAHPWLSTADELL